MRKHNISRLFIGAATITLATMIANGEAKASEHTQPSTPQQQTYQHQGPVQSTQHQNPQATQDHPDVQRAHDYLIRLNGIDETQRQRFLKQLHENPTKETAQNVFSESIKDVNNPERRVAQRNAYFEIIHNPKLSSQDRERYIEKLIENPDHAQQIWIESNKVPSQNQYNSATEDELQQLTQTNQPVQHSNNHTFTDKGRENTTSQDLKAQEEERRVVQSAFQYLLRLEGLDDKQRNQFLQQLHENPTKETAQNVFSESIKDVNNPERRVAQRKAYINLLENNKLSLGDRERLIKELNKNPDHAQQIWIESHRLSNANTNNAISEHELKRLLRISREQEEKHKNNEQLKQLQGSNSGNTASVEQFQKITHANVLDLEKHNHHKNVPDTPQIDDLTHANNDNTVNANNIDQVYPPIPVEQENANIDKDTPKDSPSVSKATEGKKFPTESIVREKASNKDAQKSTLADHYKSFKNYFNTYYKRKALIDKSVLALLGGGSKTYIQPLEIRPGDNAAYNALKHVRNYITEGINTGKVLYYLSQNPDTVKSLISTAGTLSSFSHSISNFANSLFK
ncbi:B domain-containing protein [Staphylococcus chromogenes]|uniref:B domain-containing protein n=1 Tax=Staphylococcus chromogenes TaxID=46126 RepID=UPI001E2D89B9|nr:B domain-containing protein [Staphylococcus chromogenes]MCD8904185.1 B domain-containing protein [Staphylococcus chromogenes]